MTLYSYISGGKLHFNIEEIARDPVGMVSTNIFICIATYIAKYISSYSTNARLLDR